MLFLRYFILTMDVFTLCNDVPHEARQGIGGGEGSTQSISAIIHTSGTEENLMRMACKRYI